MTKNLIEKLDDLFFIWGEKRHYYKIHLANKIIRKLIKRYSYSIDCLTVFDIVENIPQERIDRAYRQLADYNEHKEEYDTRIAQFIKRAG